ncbi:hypothetical protein [Streptomyces xanthophaeus]|uniref:Uncharacterized protein n=1 Tax=Streptomyces xanthophaeus TaxID=67385 RepID=A0A919LDA0_9ACTN|nr:hypothetical protein [Streptomyces xanthophaeus]GHI83132.1 hypothetical protein Sxan_04960 [Streptomyces xanthophaeus]
MWPWHRRRDRATAETEPDAVRSRPQAQAQEVDPWQDWLSRSPEALAVRQWWADAAEQSVQLGEDGYRERLGELLSRLSPRDFAALGFGCTRRIDRSCREPQTCSQDPAPQPATDGRTRREGPVAGACNGFWDCSSRYGIRAAFTADDRHLAVTVHGSWSQVMLWVDGIRVETPNPLEEIGYWVGDRFYVTETAAPDDHPLQGHVGMGAIAILSVVIRDVTTATTHIMDPEPHEDWSCPVAVLRDGRWRLYPTLEARDTDRPDRTLTLPS